MHEQADPRNEIAEIENAEIEAEVQRRLETIGLNRGASADDVSRAFGRVIIWCLETDSVAKAGLRVRIVAAKLKLDGTAASNERLAKAMGFRRSAAHKLGMQFSQIFGIKGPHDRSEKVCEKYRDSWRERHEAKPIGAPVAIAG